MQKKREEKKSKIAIKHINDIIKRAENVKSYFHV